MSTLAILMFLGVQEWVIIVLAIILLFGGRKIPELMRGIGQGIREFNSAKNDVKKHIEDGMTEDSKSTNDDKA